MARRTTPPPTPPSRRAGLSQIQSSDPPIDHIHAEDEGGHGEHRGDHHLESGHSEGEPWLVSYADLMTLLFGFFVIMYTFEAAKKPNEKSVPMIKFQKALARYFGGDTVDPVQKVEEEVLQFFGTHSELRKDIKVSNDPEGVQLIIGSHFLFASGSAELSPGAVPALNTLVNAIHTAIKKAQAGVTVRVTGYTDDAPISTPQFPSNWELSAARAASVLRFFERAGFNPDNLLAVGKGSSSPLFPNLDKDGVPIPENRAKNRRVVITVAQFGNEKFRPSSPGASPSPLSSEPKETN